MDRRGFIQTTGLGAVAALVSRPASTAPATKSNDSPVKKLPSRSEVNPADTWDLSSLYPSDDAWEKAFAALQGQIGGYAQFQGHLANSAETLAKCLAFDLEVTRVDDRLDHYAMLKSDQDLTNNVYQRMRARIEQVESRLGQASSFIRPEILAIPAAKMDEMLEDPALAPYKLMLARILRFKPHTLSAKKSGSWPCRARWPERPARCLAN